MALPPDGPAADDGAVNGGAYRNRTHRTRRRIVIGVGSLLALILVVVVGYAGYVYISLDKGIKRSTVLEHLDNGHAGNDINLLVMGLDSRLDENGEPLPKDIYNALHAGDQSSGGLNSNVLIFVHIPADGSSATAFSIPRDDYVDLVGCPDGECHGKIKEAYGLATDQAQRRLAAAGKTGESAYQEARDAGRKAEILTVDKFLGVKVNRFAEVTMAAFFEIAKVVQPIKVCVKENTQDTYSGAKFHKGVQEIDARQAVAFVRQRRDTHDPSLMFTDLDRSRRQQAFIVSLLNQLKQADTLLDPTKLLPIINVAKQNTVIDSRLNPISLAKLASQISGSQIHFYTLPIVGFGTSPNGEDVNLVNPAVVRATVARLIDPQAAKRIAAARHRAATQRSKHLGDGLTVTAVNQAGVQGAAKSMLAMLAKHGYARGAALNGVGTVGSSIGFAPGQRARAEQLRKLLGPGITLVADPSLSKGQLRVLIGSELGRQQAHAAASSNAVPVAVSATGGGRTGPPPTALTDLSGAGVPCVK